MSDAGNDLNHPILNLNPEEKRVYGQLFQQADTDRLGVVTGENAVRFFEKSKLAPNVLGEIWQIADTENRGLLTKPGFCVALRLIGHYQAGRDPTPELGFKPGPIPKFEGMPVSQPSSPALPNAPPNTLQAQGTGGIRIPPLTPDKIAQYSGLFERSGAQNGILAGESAKAIFERAGLPNEVLGRIWSLSDRDQKGALDSTEFIVAMHLITSHKSRAMTALPSVLPPGLYEAAARRGPPSGRQPGSQGNAAVPRQFTGPQRTASPLSRPPTFGAPPPQVAQTTGPNWLVTPQEKAKYDTFFENIDTVRSGTISGEQAVKFFSDSGLSEDALAQIWDLADIRSEGQLNREEFAVAMYLIRQQRSGSAPLPAFLPAALVPPSMRNQPQSQQPTAPAFDNANNSSNLPKSASEDLFGLDASPPRPAPVQVQQMTGSSATGRSPFDVDPFAGSKPSSPGLGSPQRATFQIPQQTGQQGGFKPFQPMSAFGASLAAQNTGGSQTSARAPPQAPQQPSQQARQVPQPSAMDDLLGDNDEEQSKKLTEDTTELANMSNQIGNLRNQMQEVQAKRSTHERDVSATNTQKQELQQRLAQFRSQYEQEVQTVKSLEQQLAESRNSTQKLQQELAMVEGTHRDLQTQHEQVSKQLEADRQENVSLKERIGSLNAEVSQLRPQIEKMKSDARQQKGMVAINKKQLTTNESERDKLQSEKEDLAKSAVAATAAAAAAAAEQEASRSVQPTPQVRSPVVSPAPSTSTNPFFRKASQQGGEGLQSPGGFMGAAPSPSAFDSLFGPSKQQSSQSPYAPPPTSFQNRDVSQGSAFAPTNISERPTPTASPVPSNSGFLRAGEAPPPPESRQFTPEMLPMRAATSRGQSVASSTRVAPPSHVHLGGTETPTLPQSGSIDRTASPLNTKELPPVPSDSHFGGGVIGGLAAVGAAAGAALGLGTAKHDENNEPKTEQSEQEAQSSNSSSTQNDLPGGFPNDPSSTPPSVAPPFNEPAVAPSGPTQPGAALGDDFDNAFVGFEAPASSNSGHTGGDAFAPKPTDPASNGNEDFYPMTQDAEESDSDSEEDGGFDDNFGSTAPQPRVNGTLPGTTTATNVEQAITQPELATENDPARNMTRSPEELRELPPISAQMSPPSYEQTTTSGLGSEEHRRASNHMPPEFEGLLPSREDPTSPPRQHSIPEQPLQTPNITAGQSLSTTPMPDTPASTVTSENYHDASSRPLSEWTDAPTSQPQTGGNRSNFDDAFADFDNLDEAQTSDDKAFDFGDSQSENEFNPTFDSPSTSTMTGFASTAQTPVAHSSATNGFQDFGSNFNQQQQQPVNGTSAFSQPSQTTPRATSHDWDAIFGSLDSAAPNLEPNFGSTALNDTANNASSSSVAQNGTHMSTNTNATDAFDVPTPKAASPELPKLGRALSPGTEHDDPILKRLTGMGYPRQQALDALERFDYDISKAVDHLASNS